MTPSLATAAIVSPFASSQHRKIGADIRAAAPSGAFDRPGVTNGLMVRQANVALEPQGAGRSTILVLGNRLFVGLPFAAFDTLCLRRR